MPIENMIKYLIRKGENMDYIIETQNLVKQYKTKRAVDNISIHVKKGDIYGLIGKNGAGKTTLMKLILGLSKPTSGEILLYGNEDLNKSRNKIGSLIEEPGLYKNCTAYENMLRFAILYGTKKEEIKELLELVNLSNTGSKKVGQFSLGMRQRLGIAIALLGNPEILILDEPINGLDPAGIKEIRDIIIKLNQKGVTFLISSHLLDELAKIVTNYGIISEGSLIEEVSAKELNERCRQFVKIQTINDKLAIKLLKNEISDILLESKPDGIYLLNHLNESAEINKFLVNKNIDVSEITLQESNFEDYFIERLGR